MPDAPTKNWELNVKLGTEYTQEHGLFLEYSDINKYIFRVWSDMGSFVTDSGFVNIILGRNGKYFMKYKRFGCDNSALIVGQDLTFEDAINNACEYLRKKQNSDTTNQTITNKCQLDIFDIFG